MIMNFIRKQFIDVIQWESPDEHTLVWRFPIADQEIQNGASLTVRESQMALFVDEGKTADVFSAGRYTLNTQTLPVLTNLKNWDKLFQSPFKSDVYFFNTRQQIGKRWGTAQPVTVRDADFGVVQLRSFGMYSYRIADPAQFFKEISGVVESYTGEQLEAQLKNIAMTQLAAAFGTSGVPFLDMAANQVLLSQKMTELLKPEFAKLGLALENFTVESITLPENVQQALEHECHRRYVALHAIPNRHRHPNGSAKRRRHGGHGRGHGRRRGVWASDGRGNGRRATASRVARRRARPSSQAHAA